MKNPEWCSRTPKTCGRVANGMSFGVLDCVDCADLNRKWDSPEATYCPKDEKSTYYDAGGISTIDFIKAKLTREQFQGYLLGNTIKYAGRVMHKGTPERDAEKLAMYSKWLEESTKGAQ